MWKRIALWAVKLLAKAAAEELLKKAQAKKVQAAQALLEIERLKTVALRAAAEAEAAERESSPLKALVEKPDSVEV